MAKTLRDLFTGSPYDTSVKKETETFIEQETSGIRVNSAVDLNNPLIYGTDTLRIASRTTRTLDTMRSGANPDSGVVGGKINEFIEKTTKGKSSTLSDVRNSIADKLGIPEPLIPTRVADKIDGTKKSVQEVLDESSGTELGKFLKQNARGNPKTVLKQSVGAGITVGKDKLRSVLFGDPTADNVNEPGFNVYHDYNTYEDFAESFNYKENKSPEQLVSDYYVTKGVDLKKVSPVYGVDKSNTTMWESKLGKSIKNENDDFSGKYGEKVEKSLSPYSPKTTYTGETGAPLDSTLMGNSLELKYGLWSDSDAINAVNVSDPYNDRIQDDLEKSDLIPLWIGYVNDNSHKLHFRTIINGVTETVSPSWSSNSFTGNPFQYGTYEGVERSVSFSLQMYCSNEQELITMWNRVTRLSEYTYPSFYIGDTGKLVNPPIIDFRLGDIYVGKTGFIESLSYTLPDSSPWETDPEIGLLPKFIDVSLTIKFIENSNTVASGLYGTRRVLETPTISGDTIT